MRAYRIGAYLKPDMSRSEVLVSESRTDQIFAAAIPGFRAMAHTTALLFRNRRDYRRRCTRDGWCDICVPPSPANSLSVVSRLGLMALPGSQLRCCIDHPGLAHPAALVRDRAPGVIPAKRGMDWIIAAAGAGATERTTVSSAVCRAE